MDVDNLKNSVLLSFVETSRYYFFQIQPFQTFFIFRRNLEDKRNQLRKKQIIEERWNLKSFFVFYIYFFVLHIMH